MANEEKDDINQHELADEHQLDGDVWFLIGVLVLIIASIGIKPWEYLN